MNKETNTYVAIMAGGAGTRFWPSSTEQSPKQFLDILGVGKSLLQLTYERFLKLCRKDHIYIVSNEKYRDLIKSQLPEISNEQIIGEPSRNNTAPCVAYISFKIDKLNPNANLIVAPSDHLITNEDDFIGYLKKGLSYVSENNSIATLGLKPHSPSTGYGYIKYGPSISTGVHQLVQFTEKPNLETAKSFIASNQYLWNSGLFLFKVKHILSEFQKNSVGIYDILEKGKAAYNTPNEKAFININYPKTPNISIDYAIMEKTKNAVTIPADLNWSDLGTWGSLFDISKKDPQNNVINGNVVLNDCDDNLIKIPANKIASIKGLSDYIIVLENDVLLIHPKSDEQEIKAIRTSIQEKFGTQFT